MSGIKLVISDVDGTLITPDHQITARTFRTVQHLSSAGIGFTVASSRPPRGLEAIVVSLQIALPVASFNGAMLVSNNQTILENHLLPQAVISRVYELSRAYPLDFWVYRGFDWFADRRSPHLEREEQTVGFSAVVVEKIEEYFQGVTKLTLVGECEVAERCQHQILQELGLELEATRSQPRFIDITVKGAGKGSVVTNLSRKLNTPAECIGVIGDGPNDIEMFVRAGLSIAMGNGAEQVKKAARFVTSTNLAEGFADGIEKYILNQAEG
ncbi:MAG: HAD family hydrolase [Acidobacteriia bacterium]|nr:HAD family hydrolase [Terriglobia bacterium]